MSLKMVGFEGADTIVDYDGCAINAPPRCLLVAVFLRLDKPLEVRLVGMVECRWRDGGLRLDSLRGGVDGAGGRGSHGVDKDWLPIHTRFTICAV